MSYKRDAHAANTKRIAALLSQGQRVTVVAASTGQPVARVERIRKVLVAARAGHSTSTIAVALGVSEGSVKRDRAALGVAASKADGGRTFARRYGGRSSAIARRCGRCGGLVGESHTDAACSLRMARNDEQRAIDGIDALAEFDTM